MIIRRFIGAAVTACGVFVLAKALSKKKRVWTVSYGKNGFAVQLTEAPGWAELAEDVLEVLPCPHPNWEWLYKVGSTRFGAYEDGDPIHSLGGALYELCNLRQSITWRFGRDVLAIPIGVDTARRVDEGWVAECDRIFGPWDDEDDEGAAEPNEALKAAAQRFREETTRRVQDM